MSKNNGGSAFPLPHGSETTSGSEGMTLRDYFAAKAMQGCWWDLTDCNRTQHYKHAAESCVAMADALLLALAAGKGGGE